MGFTVNCISFHSCCSRCWFQPLVCVIFSLMNNCNSHSNFVNGLVDNMVCGRLLTMFVQVWMTLALTCLKMVKQRACVMRLKRGCQIVGSVTIVWLTTEADDQSSHCSVMSTGVMTTLVIVMQAQHDRANLGGLWWSEACCRLPLCSLQKGAPRWWTLVAIKPVWNAGSLKSGAWNYEVSVNETGVAASSLHWHPVAFADFCHHKGLFNFLNFSEVCHGQWCSGWRVHNTKPFCFVELYFLLNHIFGMPHICFTYVLIAYLCRGRQYRCSGSCCHHFLQCC